MAKLKLTTKNSKLDQYIQDKVHDMRFDFRFGPDEDDMYKLYSCKTYAQVDETIRKIIFDKTGIDEEA